MDYTVALSVWAVSVAAPCVISWLAGDMVGSARTRRLIEADWFSKVESFAPPQAGVHGGQSELGEAPGLAGQGICDFRPAAEGPGAGDPAAAGARANRQGGSALPSAWGLVVRPEEEMSFEEQAIEAERRRERREAFARMPALSDLRAHADQIRRSESPLRTLDEETTRFGQIAGRSAQRGLTHFENSVRELQRANAHAAGDTPKAHCAFRIVTSIANTRPEKPHPEDLPEGSGDSPCAE